MRPTLVQTVLVATCLLGTPLAAESQGASTASPLAWIGPAEKSSTVSADFLRHPISSKTHRMFQRAITWMRSGDHQKAIRQLELTLAKYPASAAYVHRLLGYEFMRTDQVAASISCFDQVVSLVPHDPANHK